MSELLIQTLRSTARMLDGLEGGLCGPIGGPRKDAQLCRDAADEINRLRAEVERLEIENEKLEERNDELESKLYTPSGKPPADLNGDDVLEWLDKVVNQDWNRLKEQVKSLENENKKLRTTIGDIQKALEVEDA